jgi:hypothetical protein
MKKPIFAVQVTGRHDLEIEKTIRGLESAGLDWVNFGLIPFTKEITNLENIPKDRPVIPIGGTKVVDMYKDGLLPPNWHVFYDRVEFDQSWYSKVYGEQLLNADAQYLMYGMVADVVQTEPRFMKPSDDLKSFAGLIVEAGQTLRQALQSQTTQVIDDTDLVVSAPLQILGREWRMFIVNGVVVDISEYRDRGVIKAKVTSTSVKYMLRQMYLMYFRQKRQQQTYVMDVCEVFPYTHCGTPYNSGREFRIVEINCFNASGLYEVDVAKVYGTLAQTFS